MFKRDGFSAKPLFRPFEPQFGLKIRGTLVPWTPLLDPPLLFCCWGGGANFNPIDRKNVMSRYHGSKIYGSQQ